jgi:hypothetical protein
VIIVDLKQNDREHLVDATDRGEMTPDEANVAQVRMKRVHLVRAKIPLQVRRALEAAVHRGELCHIAKDGHKPEAFYHPSFDFLMVQERNECERAAMMSLAGVFAR